MEAAGEYLDLQLPGESWNENSNASWMRILSASVISVVLLHAQPVFANYVVETVSNGGTIEGVVRLTGAPLQIAPIKITKNRIFAVSRFRTPCTRSARTADYRTWRCTSRTSPRVRRFGPARSRSSTSTACSTAGEGANIGQLIKISSNDPVLHSTHPQNASTNATIYNIALPFAGFSVTKPLPAIPELIKVNAMRMIGCTRGFGSSTTPFATTGDDGHFTIEDVPPGTYTLVAWHEAAGEKPISVTVSAGKTVTVAIELAATNAP